mmetsp:Transcript_22680/g.33817  ORF Transcript_22680/g.33817 Transcript_22680/m.33817 type:complete len:584 (+) Transcript_22680:47-1798(+)
MGGITSIEEGTPLNRAISKHSYGSHAQMYHGEDDNKKLNIVDKFFRVSERGSTLRTEVSAGVINFVANAYLLVLMPHILHQGGIGMEVGITAFVVSTALGSLLVGLIANLPVPVGPGLGCAAFFAYGLTGSHKTEDFKTTQMGITCCFIAGLAMIALSLFGLPGRVFGVVPKCVKDAMPIGLGLLLSLCGFQQMGLVVSDPYTGVTMSSVLTVSIILGMAGAVSMAYLAHKGWNFTKFVLPIAFFTLISWFFHLTPWPQSLFGIPSLLLDGSLINFSTLGKFSWSPVLGLIIICIFDIGGIVVSVCGFADGLDEKRRDIPKRKPLLGPNGVEGEYWVFLSCGLATVVAALLGGTPVIAFGESFAGAEVGGRTGLTSIVSACCFLLSLPLQPIFRAVPLYASAPVLVLLGVILLKLTKGLKLERMFTAFPSFCTIALMPYLYSIDKAIWAGLISWCLMWLLDLLSQRLSITELGEDNVSKADLKREIDGVLIKLLNMKNNLKTLEQNGEEYPSYAPGVSDLVTSAGKIVQIAAEQLESHLDKPSTKVLKRSTSIHYILTPKIKFKQKREEDKSDMSPMLGSQHI